MHPQAYLKTFWRMELRPQVFVAMSFDPRYKRRFDAVIEPAISGLTVGSTKMGAHRVDLSKTGDSILTDIVDGIAHSELVLADVSSIGKDSVTGHAYRNGNVMYEVGIALACRHPSEVLLVRDDDDKFLFDVSSIPHLKMDFTDEGVAVIRLREALEERLRERNVVHDARVELAVAALSTEEAEMLVSVVDYPADKFFGRKNTGVVDFFGMASIPRLLDKQLIRVGGVFEAGRPAYALTPLGRVVAQKAKSGLPSLRADQPADTEPST